jgi:tRNA A37 threonylcarbamoyladenosine dehydratase
MTHHRIQPNAIPDWFLETVRVMQDIDHGLCNIQIELNHAVELDGLDPRLRTELEYVRDALDAVKISLSLMDMTAKQVLHEVTRNSRSDLKAAAT